MTKEMPHKTAKTQDKQKAKQDKLAEALRENLRRRKTQKRERLNDDETPNGDA